MLVRMCAVEQVRRAIAEERSSLASHVGPARQGQHRWVATGKLPSDTVGVASDEASRPVCHSVLVCLRLPCGMRIGFIWAIAFFAVFAVVFLLPIWFYYHVSVLAVTGLLVCSIGLALVVLRAGRPSRLVWRIV